MELETLACQDVIKLSVGGRHMSTTREVLVQVCSDTPFEHIALLALRCRHCQLSFPR